MKRGEPLWLDEDRDYALALQSWEDGKCDGCGEQLHESTTPEAGRLYRLDDPVICYGCAAVRRDLTEYDDDDRKPALKFRLLRT